VLKISNFNKNTPDINCNRKNLTIICINKKRQTTCRTIDINVPSFQVMNSFKPPSSHMRTARNSSGRTFRSKRQNFRNLCALILSLPRKHKHAQLYYIQPIIIESLKLQRFKSSIQPPQFLENNVWTY